MALGVLVCFSWYFTIIAGFYILYSPVMYCMFVNHKLYRKIVDNLFAFWELYPVGLFQWCCNTQIHLFGDNVDPDTSSIIIMNHRTRVDWNYAWIGLYHASYKDCEVENNLENSVRKDDVNVLDKIFGKAKTKFVLKDEIKYVPGMGWIMQLNYFLYVKRNWIEDQANLHQFANYYNRVGSDYRIVLFPEGTDLSEENKKKSERFALSKNLQVYQYVLHPRTTGWVALCRKLRNSRLKSVYDVTIAYDAPAQTEADLLRGNIPKQVYFYIKRYNIEDLPDDDECLKLWLNQRWSEKEITLKNFHSKGTFIDPVTNTSLIRRSSRPLTLAKISFLVWTVIDFIFIYGLFFSSLFRFWVLYHTFLMIIVTWYIGGFHKIQYILTEQMGF